MCAQRILRSAWASVQTDLSLGWAHIHFVGFVMRRLIYQTPQQRWLPVSLTSGITAGTEGMQLLRSLLIRNFFYNVCFGAATGRNKKHCVQIFRTRTFTVFFFFFFFFFFFCHKNYSTRILTESVSWHHQEMLFSKELSAEDKLHKNGFSLKIVLKIN